MAEAPKVPRTRKAANQGVKPETPAAASTAPKSEIPDTEQKSSFVAGVQGVIDWLNVVDDFKIKGHRNFLPRWVFVLIVLAIKAL